MSVQPGKKEPHKRQRTLSFNGVASVVPPVPAAQPSEPAGVAATSKRHTAFDLAWPAVPGFAFVRFDDHTKSMKCTVCENAGIAGIWGHNGRGSSDFQLSAIRNHKKG